MHVAVLGAGVIGTTTAWYLREAGHDVTVVERRGGPGEETSFANG
ncbi:MAG: FAD-dependent oxidoreductase, partial [Pseudomonadota bacterium]